MFVCTRGVPCKETHVSMLAAASAPYELAGLVPLLETPAESGRASSQQLLNTDLMALGLPLGSPGPLYMAFVSPWSDVRACVCVPGSTRVPD